MSGDRFRQERVVAVGVLLGVAGLAAGAVVTGSVPGTVAVGGVAALSAVVAGLVAGRFQLPGTGDGRRAVAAWTLVGAGTGGVAYAPLWWARLPGAVATALAAAAAVGVATGATTSLAGDVVVDAARERLSESTRARLGQVGGVLTRIPGLGLARLFRAFEDADNADTVRLLALVVVPFGLAYGAFPLDLVPDVLVPIGWIDDVTVYVLLREVVFTAHDHGTNVRGALRRMVFGRLERVLLGLAVALAAVLGAVLLITALLL